MIVSIRKQQLDLVPILIQPEDWMQYPERVRAIHSVCSNPHPARRLDAIPKLIVNPAPTLRFQSSSSPKTGCNFRLTSGAKHINIVPILIQPEDWMQFDSVLKFGNRKCQVPILIQPEDWMQSKRETDDEILTIVPILIQPEDWMQ